MKSTISNMLDDVAASGEDVDKEETVYLIADNTGKVNDTIVSEWLKNPEEKDILTDASELSDITNVKGDETFKQDGTALTWQADGNDIYYQGTTTKEAPVSEKITYSLDGTEIAAKDLAGKSGKVTIRFDYTNNEKTTASVGGKDYDVNVPFTVVTGMILNDSFKNVSVTNGKMISDGKNNIVVGFATPGLQDSLDVDASDFDSEVSLPDYVEVTADVEDFSLDMTMSVVMNGLISGSSLEDMDLSDVDDSLDSLTDATKQLIDGSGELAEGLDTLNTKLADFKTGAQTLQTGVATYTSGVETANSGAAALASGTSQLQAAFEGDAGASNGAAALASGAAQTNAGAAALAGQLPDLQTGAQAVSDGVNTLATALGGMQSTVDATFAATAGMDVATFQATMANVPGMIASAGGVGNFIGTYESLYNLYMQYQGACAVVNTLATYNPKIAELQTGATTLANGAASAVTGAGELAAGTARVSAGAANLNSGVQQMYEAVKQLNSGAGQLASGTATLVANNGTLNSGTASIVDASSQLGAGVKKLDDGANTLADGLVTFNEDGIQKLADAYNGDVKDLLNHVEAVMKAADDYSNFAGAADDSTSSVKFIIKTDSIKTDDEE